MFDPNCNYCISNFWFACTFHDNIRKIGCPVVNCLCNSHDFGISVRQGERHENLIWFFERQLEIDTEKAVLTITFGVFRRIICVRYHRQIFFSCETISEQTGTLWVIYRLGDVDDNDMVAMSLQGTYTEVKPLRISMCVDVILQAKVIRYSSLIIERWMKIPTFKCRIEF